jgi:hypothetical protein
LKSRAKAQKWKVLVAVCGVMMLMIRVPIPCLVFDLLPAIDLASEVARLLVHDRRLGVVHVALDQHAPRVARGLDQGFRDVVGADGLAVNEGGVRKIDQVVEQQHVIAFVDDGAVRVGPARRREPGQLGDEVRIRGRRIAHPDPAKFQRSTSG